MVQEHEIRVCIRSVPYAASKRLATGCRTKPRSHDIGRHCSSSGPTPTRSLRSTRMFRRAVTAQLQLHHLHQQRASKAADPDPDGGTGDPLPRRAEAVPVESSPSVGRGRFLAWRPRLYGSLRARRVAAQQCRRTSTARLRARGHSQIELQSTRPTYPLAASTRVVISMAARPKLWCWGPWSPSRCGRWSRVRSRRTGQNARRPPRA